MNLLCCFKVKALGRFSVVLESQTLPVARKRVDTTSTNIIVQAVQHDARMLIHGLI